MEADLRVLAILWVTTVVACIAGSWYILKGTHNNARQDERVEVTESLLHREPSESQEDLAELSDAEIELSRAWRQNAEKLRKLHLGFSRGPQPQCLEVKQKQEALRSLCAELFSQLQVLDDRARKAVAGDEAPSGTTTGDACLDEVATGLADANSALEEAIAEATKSDFPQADKPSTDSPAERGPEHRAEPVTASQGVSDPPKQDETGDSTVADGPVKHGAALRCDGLAERGGVSAFGEPALEALRAETGRVVSDLRTLFCKSLKEGFPNAAAEAIATSMCCTVLMNMDGLDLVHRAGERFGEFEPKCREIIETAVPNIWSS